jgi:uncharacterized protein YndB with AHSA1/START domain
MMMMTLPYMLDRTIVIRATPETVFRFFTDTDRWAAWWGAGSTIDPRPGGRVFIRYPGGIEASGEVVEIAGPDRIVFTYGFDSGKPLPAGSSRVTIQLTTHEDGTYVSLTHELDDEALRNEFVQGWRYQLSLFANAVSNEVCAGAEASVDAWLDAWSDADRARRSAALSRIAAHTVSFNDRFSAIEGFDDLSAHLDAAQRFMPGLRLRRDGAVRQCQGVVVADWVARAVDGQERGRGTNVFVLNADGRIESVTGLWNQ